MPKPGFAYDTMRPVINNPNQRGKVADVRNLRDQHMMMMNRNTGAGIGLSSIDGLAYPTTTQAGLKDVFESCFVPFNDGNKVLMGADHKTIHSIGYGAVPRRKYQKIPKGNRPGITHQVVDTKHHSNVAVYTDFPKGSGQKDTVVVWRDGTYDEAVLSATKQIRGEVADQTFADILRTNPRMRELSLAGQVGSVMFGDAMARKEIEEYFNAEKREFDRHLFRQMGYTDVQIDAIRQEAERARAINNIAPKLGVSPEDLRRIIVHRIGHPDEATHLSPDGSLNEAFKQHRSTDIPITAENANEVPEGYYHYHPANVYRRIADPPRYADDKMIAATNAVREQARRVLHRRREVKQIKHAAFSGIHSERAKLANRPATGK